MKNRVFSIFKFLIGWPFSILAFFFIFQLILPHLPTLLSHVRDLSPGLSLLGVCCFILYYFVRGILWQRLIQHTGHSISLRDASFLWATSELKRYIPGSIWGFVGRTVVFADRGVEKKTIARALIIEAELLVLGAVIVSFLSLPFLLTYSFLSQEFVPFLTWSIIIGILIYAFHKHMKLKHFILPAYASSEILFLIFISSIGFLFFGLGHYFFITSFIFLDPNLMWQIAGFSVLAFLIGYLSLLTPSGFGVREGILLFGLSKIVDISVAGFISLYTRVMLILSELIFVLFTYIWYKTKIKAVHAAEIWIGKNKHLTILLGLMVIYTIYFTTASAFRFENFYTGKYDLGNMVQTVWNTLQGRIFILTNPDTAINSSRLAIHADYILILLAPFYALWPDPRNLLFIQTVIVSFGALFVYLIANSVLKSKNVALVFGLVYLLNPSIQRANLYDFHAVVLATTFLLGTYYFLIKNRYGYFLLFAILAGLTKEHIWIIIALFGFILFFIHKKRILGAVLFFASLLISYILISHAIPGALGSQHFALSYFSEFGNSPLDIIKNIFLNPQQTINTLLTESRTDYLKQLFYPLGYLALFAPWLLIFAVPELMINLLSNNPNLHQIYYQYTAAITPFLFIAAIYGVLTLKYILTRFPKTYPLNPNPFIIIYILATALYGAYLYGPLPASKSPNLDMFTKPAADKEFIVQSISQIPSSARVATSNNLGAHLSNREHLYVLPLGIQKADYIVFYLTPAQPQDLLQDDLKLVEQLKTDPNYEIVVEKGIFIIFKKNSSPTILKN